MNMTDGSLASHEIGLIAAYAVTILVALTGNALLIFIVRRRPETRTLTSFLFVNMAAADLLVTFVVMPVSLITPYTGGKWLSGLMGHVTCKLVYYSFFVTLAASILSLTAMAVDRYLAVAFPFRLFENLRRAKVLVTVIWLSSMVFMIPVLLIMSVQDSYCSFKFSQFGEIHKSMQGFYTYIFLLIYLVPLLVITALYGLVCGKLWQRKAPGVQISETESRNETTKRKVVCRLVLIVAVFALCWLPAQVYHMILAFDLELHLALPRYVMLVCFWVGHANSAVNPWLYMTLNDKLRLALRDIVSGTSRRSRLQSVATIKTGYTKVAENSSVAKKQIGKTSDRQKCSLQLETAF